MLASILSFVAGVKELAKVLVEVYKLCKKARSTNYKRALLEETSKLNDPKITKKERSEIAKRVGKLLSK